MLLNVARRPSLAQTLGEPARNTSASLQVERGELTLTGAWPRLGPATGLFEHDLFATPKHPSSGIWGASAAVEKRLLFGAPDTGSDGAASGTSMQACLNFTYKSVQPPLDWDQSTHTRWRTDG